MNKFTKQDLKLLFPAIFKASRSFHQPRKMDIRATIKHRHRPPKSLGNGYVLA